MFWRLHKTIFANRLTEAIDILTAFGDSVSVVEGADSVLTNSLGPHLSFPLAEASLSMTTLRDAQQLAKKDYPSSPWLFYHPSHYAVSHWSSRLPSHINYLNRHGVFFPIASLATHPLIKNMIGADNKIFIRPDSGNKTFTGFDSVVGDNFDEELSRQLSYLKLEPQTMCYVAPYKKINSVEWRFWICENEVVAHTPYSWVDQDLSHLTLPPSIEKAAKELAQSSFQLDYAYVADFVLDEKDNACLIEINAASTSGVYGVDLKKLLPALRRTALREYNMEI